VVECDGDWAFAAGRLPLRAAFGPAGRWVQAALRHLSTMTIRRGSGRLTDRWQQRQAESRWQDHLLALDQADGGRLLAPMSGIVAASPTLWPQALLRQVVRMDRVAERLLPASGQALVNNLVVVGSLIVRLRLARSPYELTPVAAVAGCFLASSLQVPGRANPFLPALHCLEHGWQPVAGSVKLFGIEEVERIALRPLRLDRVGERQPDEPDYVERINLAPYRDGGAAYQAAEAAAARGSAQRLRWTAARAAAGGEVDSRRDG